MNKLKIPIKNMKVHSNKITRSNAENYLQQSKSIDRVGKRFLNDHNMAEIMKHNYLQKSMEQRA